MRFFLKKGRKGDLVTTLPGGKIAFLLPCPFAAEGQEWQGEIVHEAERFAKVHLTFMVREEYNRAAAQRSALILRLTAELSADMAVRTTVRDKKTVEGVEIEFERYKTGRWLEVEQVSGHPDDAALEAAIDGMKKKFAAAGTAVAEGVERNPGNCLCWALVERQSDRPRIEVHRPVKDSGLFTFSSGQSSVWCPDWTKVREVRRQRLLATDGNWIPGTDPSRWHVYPNKFGRVYDTDQWYMVDVVTLRLEQVFVGGSLGGNVIVYLPGEYRVALLDTKTPAQAPPGARLLEDGNTHSGAYVSFED